MTDWRRARNRAAFTLIVAMLAGCGSPTGESSAGPAKASASPGAMCLRVMSFNIEWGGAHVRFASVIEAIEAADADIVGVQEPEGNLARLASDLGWHYNLRNHIVSKYEIVDPPDGGGRYVFVEVAPGEVVAIANVHLPSDPYGPDWLRNGRTAEDVAALERKVRLPKIEPVVQALSAVHRRGIPVFLTGDFNSPSHEDWTPAAVGRFPHRQLAFEWPVTHAIGKAGLHDSYRAIHPDPVKNPGFTWWAARPRIENYNPSDKTHQNRIDMVWHAGPATATASRLVGEAGARDVSIAVSPWPSDHRAVVSEFDVQPAPMPALVATERRVHESGEAVRIVYRNPRPTPGSILLLRTGSTETRLQSRILVGSGIGRTEISADSLPPGYYQVVLADQDGNTLSRNDLWVLTPGAVPSIDIGGQDFAAGEPVPVTWSNAPGNRFDWIAVFDAAAPQDSEDYVAYVYVDAQSSGILDISSQTAEDGWPLPPGRYVARLLEDDGFEMLVESAPFAVE